MMTSQVKKVQQFLMDLMCFFWTIFYHGFVFFSVMSVSAFTGRVFAFYSFDQLKIPGFSRYYFDIILIMTAFVLILDWVVRQVESKLFNENRNNNTGNHRVVTRIGVMICAAFYSGIVFLDNYRLRLFISPEVMRGMESPINSILLLITDFSSLWENDDLMSEWSPPQCDKVCQVQISFLVGILFPIYCVFRSFQFVSSQEVKKQSFEQFLSLFIISCQNKSWTFNRVILYTVPFVYELLQSIYFVLIPLVIGFLLFYDTQEQLTFTLVTVTFATYMAILLPILEDFFMPTRLKYFFGRNIQCRFLASYSLIYLGFLPLMIIFYNITGRFSTSDGFWMNEPNTQLILCITSMAYCCFGFVKILMINYCDNICGQKNFDLLLEQTDTCTYTSPTKLQNCLIDV